MKNKDKMCIRDRKTAAGNQAGAMTGFMGMGMAMNQGGGMNAQNLFAMGQQQQEQQAQQMAAQQAACLLYTSRCV